MSSSTDSTQETWTAAIRYITGRKAAEEALGFLAHISGLLDTQPEPAKWGRSVAQVCVPYLVSAVSVDITGVPEQVIEPDERFAEALGALRGAAGRFDDGPFVISDHPKLAESSQPRPAEAPAGLVGSAAVVRLAFRNHTSGRLAVLRTREHPKGPIGPADLAVISELASRLALANAFTKVAARASITPG